jgi:hypothetical protein
VTNADCVMASPGNMAVLGTILFNESSTMTGGTLLLTGPQR